MSGRNPPSYCTLTLIAMQGHQQKGRQNSTSSNNKDKSNPIIETSTAEDHDDENLHNPETVQDAVIHLEVDEEQWAITQGSKRQARWVWSPRTMSGLVVVVVVVVLTLKAVPISTQYFLTSVLVQLTRTPSVVTG